MNDATMTQWQLRVRELSERILKFEQDYCAAATEFRVQLPEPGTDAARLMVDARNARRRCAELETENLKLLAEIEEWKEASGLECGGDPDGVTPQQARDHWANIKRIAQQRDDAVNSYINCRQDLDYCKELLVRKDKRFAPFAFPWLAEGDFATVADIVSAYLQAFDFDGLYNDECGCLLDDLAPCGEICDTCSPGKQVKAPPSTGWDYLIVPVSEVARYEEGEEEGDAKEQD